MNQYKYLSKPYTLEELVNGNPIFKIFCDFFNEYDDWEDDYYQTDIASLNTAYLELIFNEFLNILSLLIYDKESYKDTLKELSLKSKELKYFCYLANIIPNILENIGLLSDSKMSAKVENLLKKNLNSKIDNSDTFTKTESNDDSLFKIAKNHCENLNSTLTEANMQDLTNYFDVRLTKTEIVCSKRNERTR